jgi:transmembrane sensor
MLDCTLEFMSTSQDPLVTIDTRADYDSLEQAAHWYALLQSEQVSDEQRHAWQGWLSQRPQNRLAWHHVEAVSQRFKPLRADGERDAAMVAVGVSSVEIKKRRRILRGLAVTAGIGLSGWLGWRFTPAGEAVLAWQSDFHTAVGEVRQLVLPDGTRLWLNTHSAVDLAFNDAARVLKLRLGEVLVETARDAGGCPFFVETDAGRMQALGTRFTVRQQDSHTNLVVFEGRVEIRNLSGQHIIVSPGQQRQFTATDIGPVMPADMARQVWTRGIIEAEDLPLRELLREMSRYQHGHISLSPQIADLRVSGRYPLDNIPKALGMLARDLPITVSRPLPWWLSVHEQ